MPAAVPPAGPAVPAPGRPPRVRAGLRAGGGAGRAGWRALVRHRRWLLVYVLLVPMLALSAAWPRAVFVFPEAAALALGTLALRLGGWTRSPLHLALLPAACALAGVGLAHAGWPRWAGVLAALSATVLALRLLASRLTPSLSAGVFPVVFGVRAWAFPLTVLGIGLVLALLVWLAQRRAAPGVPAPASPPAGGLPTAALLTAWAVGMAWTLLAWPVLGLGAAAVAPPLIVAMLERAQAGYSSARTGLRHWAVLVAAAATGAAPSRYVHPAWLAGLLAVAVVLAVFAVLSSPTPPALAVCLIPQVSPAAGHIGAFVADIALGAAMLYGLADVTGWARRRLTQRAAQGG